jgi:opacity protein-like surface antigen
MHAGRTKEQAMKRLLFALSLFVLGISPGLAQENTDGFYVGLGLGQFNVEVDNLDEAGDVASDFDADDTSWKIFGGWRFNPYFALEVAWIDLGGPEDDVAGESVEADISGVAPYAVATLPLGIFEIFGKVGYYFYDVELNVADLDVIDGSDEDFVYGAGVGLTFFEGLNFRLEYEIIDVSDVDDANALWLTGAFRF